MKVNATYSLVSSSIKQVKVRAGKSSEIKCLSISQGVSNCLLLTDLGYFKYEMFGKIARNGDYFISRLKAKTNPVIVADRCGDVGQSRRLTGRKFWDAVSNLKRNTLDVDVEVGYRERLRKPNNGAGTVKRIDRFRIVGVRNPADNQFHFYVTNIPENVMSPKQVRVTYGARWLVENLFFIYRNF